MELSPAHGVVHTIYQHTAWFIPWNVFILLFGVYDCIIGIIFYFREGKVGAVYAYTACYHHICSIGTITGFGVEEFLRTQPHWTIYYQEPGNYRTGNFYRIVRRGAS